MPRGFEETASGPFKRARSGIPPDRMQLPLGGASEVFAAKETDSDPQDDDVESESAAD